jgi:hypothetical protein
MVTGPFPRHARPRGRGAVAAAYEEVRRELVAVTSARWTEQMEVVRLTALTEELTGQVAAVQAELAQLRSQLEAARLAPPVVVHEVQPAVEAAPSAALVGELAELRRLVAHQQQLLADLTVRLLDLLARFVPVAAPSAPPAAPAAPEGAPPAPEPSYAGPADAADQTPQHYAPPPDLVMDDETASRLRVIREAFGR